MDGDCYVLNITKFYVFICCYTASIYLFFVISFYLINNTAVSNSTMASASPPLLSAVLESWKNVKLNDRRTEIDAQAFEIHDYNANSAEYRYCDDAGEDCNVELIYSTVC